MQQPLLLQVLGPACRAHRRLFVGSTAFGVAGVLFDLARPWPLAFAVDHALTAGPHAGQLLVLAALALVLTTGALALLDMASVTWAERGAERVGAALRADVFSQAVALSPRWHDRHRSGELVSRITTDVGRLLDAVVALTITLLPDTVRMLLVLLTLSILSPQLALLALAVVPFLAGFAGWQRRRVRHIQREARTASGRLAGVTTDLLRNVRAVQSFGRTGWARRSFVDRADALRLVNERAVTIEAAWSPIADVVLAVGSGLVLIVGGQAVLAGHLSVGQLLVVTSYLTSLYSPVRALSRLSGVLGKATASSERLMDVLGTDERITERPGSRRLHAVGDVRLDWVSFAYRPGTPVLDGVDLTVRPGETVALVGPSGCGKSTVLSLILRLYDVDAGRVCIDGVDVRELRLRDLRRAIAYVPQDAWLLDVSIAENIAFAAPSATRDEVLHAGHLALVDDIAAALPRGYDTPVGENGNVLSGGQRRRIALARAVLSPAPILLLDEPTASLDPAAAADLVQAVRRVTAGRTVLLVTHDPALAATADRVIELGAGRPAGPQSPVLIETGRR